MSTITITGSARISGGATITPEMQCPHCGSIGYGRPARAAVPGLIPGCKNCCTVVVTGDYRTR